MSARFPGLGFDPAPGEPEDVRRCARQHARVAVELETLAADIARATEPSPDWRGAAATAFASALAPLPAQLRTAAEAFGSTAARLTAWAGELEELQAEARVLERTASAAMDELSAGHGRSASGAPATSVLVGGGSYAPHLDEAQEQLRRATWAAHELQDAWRTSGRRVAAAVTTAAQAAPPLPTTVGELVWQHRRGIAATADVFSLLSLPAGLLPVAGPAVAAGLGVASTAGQAALAAYAEGSLTDVALGALGVGLGGASMAAARSARSPVAGGPTRVTARGVQAGDLGYSALGTGMTVHKHRGSAPSPPAPAGAASTAPPVRVVTAATGAAGAPVSKAPRAGASPALQQLLVRPVTDEPGERP